MSLRKINATISLLTTFLILYHAIINAVWMLSKGTVAKPLGYMSWTLTVLVLIHAFISIDMAISGIMSGENHKCKKYARLNLSTFVQRISAALMVVFTGLHIAGATKYLQPPKAVHAIVPILFFIVVMAHVAVSTSKAFITLGIGNARFVKTVDIVIKAVCVVTLIADVIGFYLYLL